MAPSELAGDTGSRSANDGQVSDPHAYVQLAESSLREGLLDEAIRLCREALIAHPDDTAVRTVLARALLNRGLLDEAEREFALVLKQSPANLPALRFLGEISARKGQTEEARQYQARALRLGSNARDGQDRLAASPEGQAADSTATPPRREDPLASPTLAGLYASQGYTDVASAIFSQVGQPKPETAGAQTAEDTSGQATTDRSVLEKLLLFRESARKLREANSSPERSSKP